MADALHPARRHRLRINVVVVAATLGLVASCVLAAALQAQVSAPPAPPPPAPTVSPGPPILGSQAFPQVKEPVAPRSLPVGLAPSLPVGLGGSQPPSLIPPPVAAPPVAAPFPGAVRFHFKIDPNTPMKDLLPESPRNAVRSGPLFPTELAQVPEVAFQAALPAEVTGSKAMEKTAHQIAKINHLNHKKSDAFMEALLGQRSDLTGLPFAMGEACRTKGERTKQFNLALATVRQALQNSAGVTQAFQEVVEQIATTGEKGEVKTFAVRRAVPVTVSMPPPAPGTTATDPATTFWNAYLASCAQEDKNNAACSREHCEQVTLARIAALTQVLGPESLGLRKGLVKYLSTLSHREATRALAKLAIFSVEAEVREPALEALKVRRERDYTDILVQGLHYPWPAVARHASEAIVQLERQDLIPQLLTVLEEADPRAPVTKAVDGKQVPVVRELVRVNHHRNCLMCHAPGNTSTVPPDAVTAQVPVPGEPLPTPSTGYQSSIPDILVRVDVTYLRQDFSLKLAVADANPWPEMQRFDFLVRTRELTEEEAQAYRDQAAKRERGVLSPYHRAALAALRELTGRDTEPTAQAWRRLLDLPAQRRQDASQ